MVNPLSARGGCRQTVARPLAGARKLAGYLKNPYSENSKARTRQTWQASLTPRGLGKRQNAPLKVSDASESIKTRRWRFPRGRKASKHAAERFRGLGKHQNAPLNVSEASEGSKHAAEDFRGLGKAETSCLKISEGVRDICQDCWVHQTCIPGLLRRQPKPPQPT